MALDRTVGTTDLHRPGTAPASFGYGIGQWIETVPGTRYRSGAPTLSSPGAFGFHPWVDHLSGTAGVLMVQDVGPNVIEDISAVRDLVELATIAPPLPCASRHGGCPASSRHAPPPRKLDAIRTGQ